MLEQDQEVQALHNETEHIYLKGAKYVASPNCTTRDPRVDISLLVIHCISLPPNIFYGTYIQDLFTNTLDITKHGYFTKLTGLKVSSHLLIRRNGFVMQFVPFDMQAWHAGVSSFKGRGGCNNYSIGIELEGNETQPYSSCQYAVLADIVKTLQMEFTKITDENIVGHEDIAPGRKSDPGPSFDWELFLRLKNS
ncbi:MAG: 1,6-anhydro-N-acetylmuramyl-L-alanine amidase AmpD [Francisellaceae bacterium]|nr:1,6-anhydro-N-acetylmuramyl-L-alanine amidase AmpD [Francisellaceae bacterium]MBT6539699.1 1,6-anhydro-N-acetylmuramyl-L-alanine amidase AmpD [Francisellaceae bacterium]